MKLLVFVSVPIAVWVVITQLVTAFPNEGTFAAVTMRGVLLPLLWFVVALGHQMTLRFIRSLLFEPYRIKRGVRQLTR
jgi:hypothetical protein